jgi:hypothetical protein
MKTIEYRFIDKSTWERGEWDSEPDKVQWQDKQTNLPCLAVRHERLGNWCGYVGIQEGHPWFGQSYDEASIDVSCHGGLTFSGFCREDDKEHGICHLVEPGEPDKVWWFGFDCCHGGDFAPGLDATIRSVGGGSWPADVYRTLNYVRQECVEIAKQLQSAR